MKTAAPERVDLPVSGMTCASCARMVEGALAETAGVERAHVNLATDTATVEYDASRVGVRDFVGAIEELGYGVPERQAPEHAAVIIALVLAGRLLEARARAKAGEAIRKLMDLQPPIARVVRDGAEVEIGIDEVRAGDELVARPGEHVAVDGVVTQGESALDEA